MEKMKLQIELNNRPYSKDVIYAAVSLRGGYATRNYLCLLYTSPSPRDRG